jgi:mannose-1-phosphate guanylyltransferase/mannose-6-phosphate isomerase
LFETLDGAAGWYRAWLTDVALPYWGAVGFDPDTGGFHERMTAQGPDRGAPRRSRVQARQIWTFATAARLKVGPSYFHTAYSAYEAFIQRYRGADDLMVSAVRPDGQPIPGVASLYEQDFAILAMAGLYAVRPSASLLQDAQRLRAAIETFRHPAGGFRETDDHPFQSNAHMHLLEASLAWEEVGQEAWATLTDEVAELALARFIDPQEGFLREFFDSAWRPASGADGRRVEPGHQVEWAWLLDRWGARRGDPRGPAAAQKLFAAGRAGFDATRKVAVNALWDDLTICDADARLWPQTEYLKAALRLGHDADALLAAQGLVAYLDKPVAGAWRDVLRPDGSFVDQPAPATSFYHLAGAVFALIARPTSSNARA